MKTQLLIRRIHYWLSPLIVLPCIVIFCSGLLLQSKKFVGWVQPLERRGTDGLPALSMSDILNRARDIEQLEVREWKDISRVDFRPAKGMLKIIARNRWEAQLDAATGEVLQVAYRRSDLIEALHDGSWFGSWVKSGLFLPTAVILIVMSGTGIYLFLLPLMRKRQRNP